MFLHNLVHLAFTANHHQGLTGGCFVWTKAWMGFHTSPVKSAYFGVSASHTEPNANFIIACHMFCDTSLNVLLEQVKGHIVLAVSVLLWSRLNQGLERAGYKTDSRTKIFSFSLFSLFAILKAVYNYVWSQRTDGSLLGETKVASCSCMCKCSCRLWRFLISTTKLISQKLYRQMSYKLQETDEVIDKTVMAWGNHRDEVKQVNLSWWWK